MPHEGGCKNDWECQKVAFAAHLKEGRNYLIKGAGTGVGENIGYGDVVETVPFEEAMRALECFEKRVTAQGGKKMRTSKFRLAVHGDYYKRFEKLLKTPKPAAQEHTPQVR